MGGSNFRGFFPTPTPIATLNQLQISQEKRQLEHKIRVSVFDYAPLTLHKARNGHTNQKKAVTEVKVPLMS